MQLIGASRLFVCDDKFRIICDGGIVFDQKILEVGTYEDLKFKYPHIPFRFFQDCVLLPTFSNPHIHFEFSSHTTAFQYGGFDLWLNSVLAKRDEVLESSVQKHIKLAIRQQVKSGVGLVGAVSSYGLDLDTLAQSPLRIVFFNEALGINPEAIDLLYADVLRRIEDCRKYDGPNFRTGLGIHSPYSVHHFFAKKLIEVARVENLPTSVHFLESKFEREWLDSGRGWFLDFYKKLNFFDPKPFYKTHEFLNLFRGLPSLFVHALFASPEEYQSMQKTGFIVSCPRSNRLLNNRMIELENLNLERFCIATDGMSSNIDLDYLCELRSMVFSYQREELMELSKTILLSSTRQGAKALGFNCGVLECGNYADFSIFKVEKISSNKQEALAFLLHAKEALCVYINGRDVLLEDFFYD